MEINQVRSIYVTFPHGRKFTYLTSIFVLANGVYIGIDAYLDLSVYYYLIFVLAFLPFLYISLKSQLEKHKFELMDDRVVIGETTIPSSLLKKMVIYKPNSIYFHVISSQKGKRVITIQLNKNEAEQVILQIKKWAQLNGIKIELNY